MKSRILAFALLVFCCQSNLFGQQLEIEMGKLKPKINFPVHVDLSKIKDVDPLVLNNIKSKIIKDKISVIVTNKDSSTAAYTIENAAVKTDDKTKIIPAFGKFLKSNRSTLAYISLFQDKNELGRIAFILSPDEKAKVADDLQKVQNDQETQNDDSKARKKNSRNEGSAAMNALDANEYVSKRYGNTGIFNHIFDGKYNKKLNQIKDENIIHIFIDEDGNFIKSSLPTTAREDNIYVFHVVYEYAADKKFNLEYQGDYNPLFEVYGTTKTTDNDVAGKNGAGSKKVFTEALFGAIGPFTTSFTAKITDNSGKAILDKVVKIAKLHHITLTAGIYGSLLQNPQDIKILKRDNTGDSTLTANDPTQRGIITVMLTFYPRPRNILYPFTDFRERIGICIGTGLSKNLSENFFGGVSYDIARGLGLTAGVHYGRRAVLIDRPNFIYGKDQFSGSLENHVVQKWDAALFLGVNIDMRLLEYIYKSVSPANQ